MYCDAVCGDEGEEVEDAGETGAMAPGGLQ
jgi:hypothetical protein